MAPEQTGRMDRSIDSRSDLYALGVTLYQLMKGVLPFTATDQLEWVHCHVARRPMPPADRGEGAARRDFFDHHEAVWPRRPRSAADRRRPPRASAALRLRQAEAQRRIADFPLGEHDAHDRLLIPEKLYGREREIEALLSSFDRVVRSGAPELVLISGYSGVGKSAVVHELHRALVPRSRAVRLRQVRPVQARHTLERSPKAFRV